MKRKYVDVEVIDWKEVFTVIVVSPLITIFTLAIILIYIILSFIPIVNMFIVTRLYDYDEVFYGDNLLKRKKRVYVEEE